MKVSQEAGVDLKAESLEGTGDIKEFSGISKTEFSNLLNYWKTDGIPAKIVSAIERSQYMKKNSEAVLIGS